MDESSALFYDRAFLPRQNLLLALDRARNFHACQLVSLALVSDDHLNSDFNWSGVCRNFELALLRQESSEMAL